MQFLFSFILLILSISILKSQGFQPPASTPADRIEAFNKREALKSNSLINNIPFKNVGPTIISGRVVDVAVNPKDPTIFYVAYASGGLWKTTNNGTSFNPIFDNEAVMTIGDFDVHWESGTIYVGTGEVNSSRSSYAGLGVFVSKNDGATWENIGLNDSHHIGKVIVSEDNPNEVIVGVLGHLYSDNNERGIYKTTDGGKNWKRTLFINNKTGVVDIRRNPTDKNILYASSWERERKAWDFKESGKNSAIYKSADNGNSWQLLSNEKSGFPTGEGVGRIGLAVYSKNGVEKIYALLDNYNRRPMEPKKEKTLTKDDLRTMTKEAFMELTDDELSDFLTSNRFDRKYSAKKIKGMVKSNEIMPITLVEYLEDANSLLFDSQVIGAEVYLSEDGGRSWKKTHDSYIENLYSSYGYYFGVIDVSPIDPDKIYIAGVPILRSDDGGKNWVNINGENVHSDHHSIWIDPNRPGHLINGNDGGINISYDDGENWIKCNSPAVGQFYYVNVDQQTPYNIYGGAQDNGVWFGPSNYEASSRWHGTGQYPYRSLVGGDGMQVQIDSRDNNIVYGGLQFGAYFRINRANEDRKFITPQHELGERPYRWNWLTPILLSKHNQDVLYMGSNFLQRSMDKGDNFTIISGDLTNGGKKGDVSFGTLSSIDESPFRFGLLYTGSDDGVIQISKDGGYSWNIISNKLPQDMWVSRVQASVHNEASVFVSLNGYRWDDFTPYLYVSDNYGETWKRLGKDLPHEAINVVKEDPVDENILYVGTDHGLYVSFDRGENFTIMSNNLPAVAIHDLVIQPEAQEIILGTHGRSFYKASVKELQQLNKIKNKQIHLFALESVRSSPRWGRNRSSFNNNPGPNYEFSIFSNESSTVKISVNNAEDELLTSFDIKVDKGITFHNYDLTVDEINVSKMSKDSKKSPEAAENGKFYLIPGKYKITASYKESKEEQTLEIK